MPLSNVGNGISERKVYHLLLQLKNSILVRTIKSHCPMPQISLFANRQYARLHPANYILLSHTPGQ